MLLLCILLPCNILILEQFVVFVQPTLIQSKMFFHKLSLFAIACEDPGESGRPISHWTTRELADELIKRNIVESISPRHVGRLPDEADLKPHQIRHWLTPSEDEDFDGKVRDISELYITAPERAKQGEQTLSTDEMTGVQALERKAFDLPFAPGKVQRREFE
jgi:hypothetical protein